MDNKDKILILRKLIDYLQMTDANFGQSIGVSKSEISKYLNGKQPITDKLIRKIIANYPNINPTWLLLGVGDMHNLSTTINPIKGNNVSPSACATVGVPYFNIESAACGALSGFGEALTANNSDGAVVIPTLPTKDGDIFLQTRGRSMIDTRCPERSIPEGAMVLVRRWTQSFIEWGEIYCLATTDGYVIKKLLPGSTDSTVKCVSADSDNYPPYEISTIDIKALGRVMAIVSTQML